MKKVYMRINNKFMAFVESFETKFPAEVSAISMAYKVCCESNDVINGNKPADDTPVIPDASPEQLTKFKQTVDEVIPKQIAAKETLRHTNDELKSIKKDIDTENEKHATTSQIH